MVGHERMSFLDAYLGYHQITMFGPDEEKTTFISPKGVYCYKVIMSFGLKSAESNLPEDGGQDVRSSPKENNGGIYRRHGS